MKRKILNLLVALALVLGLSLIPAIALGNGTSTYAAYKLGATTGNDAEWSTTEHSGSYSANLTWASGDNAYVEFTPAPGTKVSDLTNILTAWGFWYNFDAVSGGPNLELRFTSADCVDPGGAGHVDINVQVPTADVVKDAWTNYTVNSTKVSYAYGNDPVNGDSFAVFDPTPQPLSGVLAAINNTAAMLDHSSNATNWQLIRVRAEIGWGGAGRSCLIDDISIAGTTYDLEPMVLDDTYYKTNDTVIVNVFNSNANDPMAIDSLTIMAKSDTDTVGDTSITLTETGANTGIFSGVVNVIGTPPAIRALDQIVVSAGDTVTVECATGSNNWGAGAQAGVTVTATVDATAPVITVVSPVVSENITDATPVIHASYTDTGSGTDNATAVMRVDGSIVAAIATTTDITYTPTTNMTDGSHMVTVNISDKVGNAAIQKSWTFTVDLVGPVITGQVATPALIPPVKTLVTFTATVNDASSGVETVEIDLSSIGTGLGTQTMRDNGVAPDATAGDHIYTTSANVTEDTETTYTLPVTATDYASNDSSADITVIVSSDSTPPVITDPVLTYPAGFSSARPGDTVTISANVTDNVVMGTVTADSDAFAGPVTLLDADADDIYTGTVAVAAGTAADDYTITITATDAKGNVATPESLTLTVTLTITSYSIDLVEGWNLVSSPLIPDDSDIDVILADISDNVSQVRTWVSVDGVLTEKVWGSGPSDLTEIVDGQGYWFEMTMENTLTISGVELPAPPNAPPAYNLYAGWNLIGFKSVDVMAADDYFGAAVTDIVVRMYGYDVAGGVYTTILVAVDNLQPGQGYWLAVSDDGTIYP
jgi:hypothetical protein